MATTKDIIEINITRQTQGVSRAGFGVPLFLGTNAVFSERVRAYSSLSGVEEDFATTDDEYIAASKFFSQSPRPNIIKIGKQDLTATETLTEALNAVQDYDNDWYFLTTYTHTAADIEEIAEWTEAQTKLYFASYAGADAIDAGLTTDPGSVLALANYDRTALIYSTTADTEFPECAWVGKQATTLAGSSTWAFKTVNGVTPSNLNTTQSLTLIGTKFDAGKGYNIYQNIGGVNIFFEGRMVGGEFIDVMRGADALEARIRERIYQVLVNVQKLGINEAGFGRVVASIRDVLSEFNARGFVEPDFTVTAPNPRTLDPNMAANRVVEGFNFSARLTGAIHYIGITGELTLSDLI